LGGAQVERDQGCAAVGTLQYDGTPYRAPPVNSKRGKYI